jgi:hypothetical protein
VFPPSPSLLCILIAVCPVAIYCVILARINRGPHPVVVAGIHDCAGLLLAMSGLLLVVLPGILTDFNFSARDIWLNNHYSSMKVLGHQAWLVFYACLVALYVLGVFGGGIFLLLSRRRVTSIYNVEPVVLDSILLQTLERLGVESTRVGNRVLVGYPKDSSGGRQPNLLVEVNPWPALRHVTLHWSEESAPGRKEIESEFVRALSAVQTPGHTVGAWLMRIAALLFTLLFFITYAFQFAQMHAQNW